MPEEIVERHVRSSWSLPAFATAVTFAFLVAAAVTPDESASATALAPGLAPQAGQGFDVDAPDAVDADRDDFDVSHFSTAPAVGTPDPGTAQAIAFDLVAKKGWNQGQYECLVALWTRESNWNVFAHNPSSGAYGIPQALPGDKMATAGADWKTNPRTQIVWGLGYIQGRYGTPCQAWEHSELKGWY